MTTRHIGGPTKELMRRLEMQLMGGGAFEGGSELRRPYPARLEGARAGNVIDLMEWKRRHQTRSKS